MEKETPESGTGFSIRLIWYRFADIQEVLSIQPYTSKDFQIRSCANRVRDLSENLQFLYPEIPRDSAFAKYYTATGKSRLTINVVWFEVDLAENELLDHVEFFGV